MKCVYMFTHHGCGKDATHRYKRNLNNTRSTWRPICAEHLALVKKNAKEKLVIQRYATEESNSAADNN